MLKVSSVATRANVPVTFRHQHAARCQAPRDNSRDVNPVALTD